jgi:hypothetical protein
LLFRAALHHYLKEGAKVLVRNSMYMLHLFRKLRSSFHSLYLKNAVCLCRKFMFPKCEILNFNFDHSLKLPKMISPWNVFYNIVHPRTRDIS